jgi:hypothetical protein
MTNQTAAGLASHGACLTLDETAAAVTAPPELSGELFAYFHGSGVPCSVASRPGGRDVIDFGNPSPDEERRIRALFAAWRESAGGRGVSPEWYVWVALAVVAVWLVALFVS